MRVTDLEKIEKAAGNIENECSSFLKTQEKMEQLTNEMKTYFQMNAADTFYNEYPKLDEAMKTMRLCMKAYRETMKLYVDIVRNN